jgi:hypothetical protein
MGLAGLERSAGERLLDSSDFPYGLLGLGVHRLQRQPADGSPDAG